MGEPLDKVELRFRNLDLERQLLAYFVKKDPSLLTLVEPAWFSSSFSKKVCATLRKYRTVMSLPALLQVLKSDRVITSKNEKASTATVIRIHKEPVAHMTKKGAQLMIDQLAQLHESSEMILGINQVVKSMSNGWDIDGARRIFRRLSQPISVGHPRAQADYVTDFEYRAEMVRERARAESSDIFVVPTGIGHFDRWVGGGLLKSDGEFGIILGRPNVGKSATLVAFGAHAFLQDLNVVYCSGEMSVPSVEFRLDAHLAAVPARHFREGSLSDDHWRRWEKTMKLLANTRSNYLEVLSFPRHFTMEHVEEKIEEVEDRHGAAVDLVLLDYINILQPKGGPRGEWRSQADVVWDFKGFLKEHNGGTAGWAPGQITDDAMDKDILGVEDAKYARAISETAPIVVGLVQTDEDLLNGRLQFQTIKLRESKYTHRAIYLHPNLDIMRIDDALNERSLRSKRKEVADLNEVRSQRKNKGKAKPT